MFKRSATWFFLVVQVATAAVGQRTPAPPGTMVDVGGFKVHITCVGQGRPAVIFLHGLGEYSFDWALVQPAVATHTQACAYDRPSQAWSDPGPPPRGIRTSASELHRLLQRAHVKGPYILVGQSWGGLIARMYARAYSHEVAGMVLVDSAAEDEYLWINGKIVRPRLLTDQEWADLTKPKKPVPTAAPGAPAAPARITKVPPPYDKLPAEAQMYQLWAMSLPWSQVRFQGGDTVDIRQDFVAMYETRKQSEHPLGNIPLVVLSKTPGIDDDDDYTQEQLAWNRGLQAQLVALSTNSLYIVADRSGHDIQLDEPSTVVAAVLRVVNAVKHKRLLRAEPTSAADPPNKRAKSPKG